MRRQYLTGIGIVLAAAGAPVAAGAGWQTTIIRETDASPAIETGWATTVYAARASGDITTASIDRGGDYRPQAGPRLTGRQHALAGAASFYWQDQLTAAGEVFDKRAMTAAHKTLPFGTRVRVTRADTGRSVVVRINDRGPYMEGRVIDLSEKAAEDLGMTGLGVTPVKLEVLGR